MNENQFKKRNWIKNAAIIFLSVMLVLTFFSNTIMNYSLPEVAIQYTQSGSITSEIRGSGEVKSGELYNVIIDEARTIQSVRVKTGDEVVAGDILYVLEDKESEELIAARTELENLETNYKKKVLDGTVDPSIIEKVEAGQTVNVTVQQNKLKEARAEIARIEGVILELENQIDRLTTQIQLTNNNGVDLSAEQAAIDKAKATLAATVASIATKNTEIGAVEDSLEANDITKNQGSDDILTVEEAQSYYDGINGTTNASEKEAAKAYLDEVIAYEALKTELAKLEADRTPQEAAVTKAEKAYTDKKDAGVADIIANLENQKSIAELNVASLNKDLDAAQALENSLIKDSGDQIDLAVQYKAIQTLKEKIRTLEGKSIGATVTAPVSGTITTVSYEAGQETMAGENGAVIQPAGDTFTLSFSVTKEQAGQVKTGTQANIINNWYYNNLKAILVSIRPDPENPVDKKLLLFELEGEEITVGQSITLGVGEKSGNYDIVVPNSAIKEDNNGNFVLVVEQKSSPVGTRYIAKRVDVEVIKSDDTKSAVVGELSGWGDAIITTTTQPVEAGQLVRLAKE